MSRSRNPMGCACQPGATLGMPGYRIAGGRNAATFDVARGPWRQRSAQVQRFSGLGAAEGEAPPRPGFDWGSVVNDAVWGGLLGLVVPGVSVKDGVILGAVFGARRAVWPLSGGPRFDAMLGVGRVGGGE